MNKKYKRYPKSWVYDNIVFLKSVPRGFAHTKIADFKPDSTKWFSLYTTNDNQTKKIGAVPILSIDIRFLR
jgi:hypothetical protein